MPIATADDLGELLRTHRLLSAQQLGEVDGALRPAFPEPRELVRRSWLTPLQVNALFLGRADELVIGPCWSASAPAPWARCSRPATSTWTASSPSRSCARIA
jgi:hypothetical protein